MDSFLLALIIFLLIILMLMFSPKRCNKQIIVQQTNTTPPTAPNQPTNTISQDRFDKIISDLQSRTCEDEEKREEMKREIKKILTCKCSNDPLFCETALKPAMTRLEETEAQFIDVDIETPCLDKEYIAFEEAVANMIYNSGINICDLNTEDLNALGRYIDNIVDTTCGLN